jgi:hypothetical protein
MRAMSPLHAEKVERSIKRKWRASPACVCLYRQRTYLVSSRQPAKVRHESVPSKWSLAASVASRASFAAWATVRQEVKTSSVSRPK